MPKPKPRNAGVKFKAKIYGSLPPSTPWVAALITLTYYLVTHSQGHLYMHWLA